MEENTLESNSSLNDFQYIFYGKVHPERAGAGFYQPVKHLIHIPYLDMSGTLEINIICSQISAILSVSKPVEDIWMIKSSIELLIKQQVDVLGYCLGCGYNIEIIGSLNPSNIYESVVFGVGVPVLEAESKRRMQKSEGMLFLLNTDIGWYLRLCLNDLREAIRSPKDMGFFCYRGIESLKQYFQIEKEIPNDKRAWEVLRSELSIEKKDIDFIKGFADHVRHGGLQEIYPDDGSKILTTTWGIVDNFIEYGLDRYKPLNEEQKDNR